LLETAIKMLHIEMICNPLIQQIAKLLIFEIHYFQDSLSMTSIEISGLWRRWNAKFHQN